MWDGSNQNSLDLLPLIQSLYISFHVRISIKSSLGPHVAAACFCDVHHFVGRRRGTLKRRPPDGHKKPQESLPSPENDLFMLTRNNIILRLFPEGRGDFPLSDGRLKSVRDRRRRTRL